MKYGNVSRTGRSIEIGVGITIVVVMVMEAAVLKYGEGSVGWKVEMRGWECRWDIKVW